MQIAKTITLGVVVLGVAAAAVHGIPAPANTPVEPTVARDESTWAMPLDAYVTPDALLGPAENLLVAPCLRAAGLTDWNPPAQTVASLQAEEDDFDSAERANPSPSLATTRPLDAALAAARGYHGPAIDRAAQQAEKDWAFDPKRNSDVESLPDGTFEGCLKAARKRLGSDVSGRQQSASELAQRLTYLAALDARSDDAVVAAAARWRTCMAPADVTDLPEAPSGMPTASMRHAYGLGLENSEPTDAEKAVAERDVSCQASSGYRRALYAAEWSRLTHVTADDARTLATGSTDNPALRERLVAVIDGRG
jgi:hypothetical protein